jgi:hypothetical protein
MANILTAAEAATVLRCDVADANMLQLLPSVDAYIDRATGRDWAVDAVIRPEAKSAARMLLVRWHEDPGGMAAGNALGFGLSAVLVQLEALALLLETDGVPDEALAIAANNLADKMNIAANLVLIFNHPMAAGAVNQVVLKDSSGVVVASTNTLDITSKILTINPDANLTAGSTYTIVITAAADAYGQTLTADLIFTTA